MQQNPTSLYPTKTSGAGGVRPPLELQGSLTTSQRAEAVSPTLKEAAPALENTWSRRAGAVTD